MILRSFLSTVGVGLLLAGCSNGPVAHLPGEDLSVQVKWGSEAWIVTVRNSAGSASGELGWANDKRRTNIYLTPSRQLVVIEQGGFAACFAVPRNGPPTALTGGMCDEDSDRWRYVGVIEGKEFRTDVPECIPLLGEGSSPFRRAYQRESFC